VISAVKEEVAQIHGLENDAASGIKLGDPFHEKGTEPSEEVAGNHNPGAGRRSSRPGQGRQAPDQLGQLRLELVERGGRLGKLLPLLPQPLRTARGADHAQHMLDFDEDVGQNNRGREMVPQGGGAEAKIIIVGAGVEEKNVRQALLGDEAFEVPHIGVADARGAAANHVEAGDFAGLAKEADVEELADAGRG